MAKSRKIGEIPSDNVDHNVTEDYIAKLKAKKVQTYMLAEIDSGVIVGSERTGMPALTLLHMECSHEEEELLNQLQSKPCQFTINGRVVEGTLCFVTKELSLVDGVIASLKRSALRNQYGIHVLTQTTDEVNHQIVLNLITELQYQNLKCHKSNKYEEILHKHADRSYLEKIMLYWKATSFDMCYSQTLISYPEMKKESWQLIQYSTKPDEIIFRIVPYMDTKRRDINQFKDVVAYIRQGNYTYQAILLFSSMIKDEILDKFKSIQHFLKTARVPLPSEIDSHINTPTAIIFKRPNLFQPTKERDSDSQLGIMRNKLDQITDGMVEETREIISQFTKIEEFKMRHYLIEKVTSLNEAQTSPESSTTTVTNSTPTLSDMDCS